MRWPWRWRRTGELSEPAERQRAEIAGLREQVARLVERDAERDAELEELRAGLAVLQRMLFGRSSEKSSPEPQAGGDDDDSGGGARDRGNGKDVKRVRGRGRGGGTTRACRGARCPGISQGRVCCPECGEPFTPLGDHWSGEQLDWQVRVRLVAHCRRRYRRACSCRVPATVMAPGPPKAVGKGLFSNGVIAMLLTERYVAGRSQNSLVTGLARQGPEIPRPPWRGRARRPGRCWSRWRTRSRPGRGIRGTCTRTKPRGGCSPRATAAARRNGGYGCSPARTPAASSWIPPVPGRCWPVTPGSTRRLGSSRQVRTAGRAGW